MENYNGEYQATYCLTVKSNTHRGCLDIYNKFKYLVRAFDFGNITLYEYKSVRKGDVLSRELQIIFVGYAPEVLAFKEAIDIMLSKIDIYFHDTVVNLHTSEVMRKDARLNLIIETS